MLSEVARRQLGQLPPPLQPLGRVPELVDALLINSTLDAGGMQLRLTVLCTDDKGAEEVETILKDALATGQAIAIAQIRAVSRMTRKNPKPC